MIKLIAFDLDGTLTQHRTKLDDKNKAVLDALSKKYKLLMIGAGQCQRIFDQMNGYPIDIIGNYGLTYGEYDKDTKQIVIKKDIKLPCDKDSVDKRIAELRARHNFNEFAGESYEIHPSGCVVFTVIGTKAKIEDKLAFDPDRKKRRAAYEDVKKTFSDYTVFIGGSSSFDMVPAPYDKCYALKQYCAEHGYSTDEVAFVGDDYHPGGNDESVYKSDIKFYKIDDYKKLGEVLKELL